MTTFTSFITWLSSHPTTSQFNQQIRDNGNYFKERLGHYINLVTTDTTVSNTAAADQTLWSYSVPGNEMTASGLMRFDFRIYAVNTKGTSGTLTYKFFIGANSVTLLNAQTINNAAAGYLTASLYIRGDASTSLQSHYLNGNWNINASAQAWTIPTSGTSELTTATDITTAQTWKLTTTLSAASASFSTTCRFAGLTYNYTGI